MTVRAKPLLLAGTRPNCMKVAPAMRAVASWNEAVAKTDNTAGVAAGSGDAGHGDVDSAGVGCSDNGASETDRLVDSDDGPAVLAAAREVVRAPRAASRGTRRSELCGCRAAERGVAAGAAWVRGREA